MPDFSAQRCRFRDCTHTNEPGCAVRKAVESGELDVRRLESYRKLEHETSYDDLSSKVIGLKKCERMFKEVSSMKMPIDSPKNTTSTSKRETNRYRAALHSLCRAAFY